MDFKELNYVISIAKNKNITRAAKELEISQPSLSRYLQNLEKNLGVSLFDRIGHDFILTYAGSRYIEYANEIIKIKNNIDAEFSEIVNHQKGRLNVACSILRSSYIISETVPKFKERYPNININFIEETQPNNLDQLLIEGRADIGIYNYTEKNYLLDCELIKDEEIVLVVNRNNPLVREWELVSGCKHPWIDIKKFKNEKFILNYPEQKIGDIAIKTFKKYDMNPEVALRTRNVECAVRLTLANFGISFASETHLNYINCTDKPICFSIGDPNTSIKLFVVFRKGNSMPQYIKDYIKILKDVIG